jgi:alkanesulfonate monooxygenase SsuD/methylene tetrahydromethanopterin reductase-like flavin-dependent oxidoreductase (luciferase family)
MKLGYFTMPVHPPDRPYPLTLRQDREAFLLADRLGYAEGYVGEHVTDVSEPITDSAMFLASLAADTTQIRLGTGTVNLPSHHPALVASKIAMLDHLLDGRLNFGVGPGGTNTDFEVFGVRDVATRRARFQEALDHVLALWAADGPFDLAGEHWTISTTETATPERGLGRMVKPLQVPHPPIVITASEPSSGSARNAGRHGWGMISGNFLLPWIVATHWQTYAEAAAEAGLEADPEQWRVARSIFVADDAATAADYLRRADGPYRYYYEDVAWKIFRRPNGPDMLKIRPDMTDDDVTVDYLLDHLVIAGTPEQVVEQLLDLVDVVGPFGTLLYAGKDWVDPELARRSMELMATEVMPELNRRLAGAQARIST